MDASAGHSIVSTLLDQFHPRYLRKIAHIKWQDRTPNTAVPERCEINGIESQLMDSFDGSAMLSAWMITGFQRESSTGRLLILGTRSCSGQCKRYKDTRKANMKFCGIPTAELESRTVDRNAWRTACIEGTEKFESRRIDELKEKRQRRKLHSEATTIGEFKCDVCSRTCESTIGCLLTGGIVARDEMRRTSRRLVPLCMFSYDRYAIRRTMKNEA